MTARFCDRCSRACGDAYACKECAKTAIENLRHIADLASALDEKRAKVQSSWDVSNLGQSRPPLRWRTTTNERATFAASPTFAPSAALNFDPRVTRVAHRVKNALVGIARDVPDYDNETVAIGPACRCCTHRSCADRRPKAVPRGADSPVIARWLTRHVPWLRTRPEAGETFDRIDRICGELHALFDNPPPTLYLGRCNADTDDGPCPESLYVDREKITEHATCPRCATQHPVSERRTQLLASVDDYLGTAKEISHLLRTIAGRDVSERRIREYAGHGLLTPMGTRRDFDTMGRPRDSTLYRIAQVRAAAEQAQERRAARQDARSRRGSRVC